MWQPRTGRRSSSSTSSTWRYLSSTGFAVLFRVVRDFKAAGGQIKLCKMDEQIRLGAEIVGLEQVVEIAPPRRRRWRASQKDERPPPDRRAPYVGDHSFLKPCVAAGCGTILADPVRAAKRSLLMSTVIPSKPDTILDSAEPDYLYEASL